MFVVSESDATAIRTAWEQGGELAAVVELRRLFPAVRDNTRAAVCAATIAGWKPRTRPDASAAPLVGLHPTRNRGPATQPREFVKPP